MDKRTHILILLLAVMSLAFSACQRSADSEPEDAALTIPTLAATATPVPIPTVDLPSLRPTMTPMPTREVETVAPVTVSEPRLNQVNAWLNWFPPAGWETAVGPDGVITSPALDNPGVSSMMIRQWAESVDLSGWQSYFPNGKVDTNGHASIVMAGYDWDGVFLTCPDYSCRAFFAVTDTDGLSYSLLVYVPSNIDLTSTADPKESLYSLWDAEAVKLNATLQTLNIDQG
ncbi:MAG: hypothetical protein GY803_24775 [Chloroflexi bacterium]|nr:hypothetical protein [Chloroflexota bacterium]